MSSDPPARRKRTATTADDVFARLVEGILLGTFASGSPLREARLARQWRVSRTPLREAVRRAAEAGFVVLRTNQAPLVRRLSATDVAALYDLRELLEVRALELAWPQLTPPRVRGLQQLAEAATPGAGRQWRKRCLAFDLALHLSWLKRCGNDWLAADLARQFQFLRIFQSWMGRDDQALRRAYAEHGTVLAAIARRDLAAARQALRLHIRASAAAVQRALPSAATNERST